MYKKNLQTYNNLIFKEMKDEWIESMKFIHITQVFIPKD